MAESNGRMRFLVRTSGAAESNSQDAKLREQTRMAMIAHALDQLGHSVIFDTPGAEIYNSDRWKYFSHIPVKPELGGLVVAPDRKLNTPYSDVIVKTTVSNDHDQTLLGRCKVLVAHEVWSKIRNNEKVLNIPFFVHDRMIDDMVKNDSFNLYLHDEVDEFRELIPREITRDVGFIGARWPQRKAFFVDAPEWVDHKIYDTHPLSAWDHAKYLRGCKAAIALRGDTPKTNLPSLLLLLGVPVVCVENEYNTPSLDENSMIEFKGWEDLKKTIDSDETLLRIADNATEVYLEGWSPLGVARQIIRKLRS